MPKMIKFMRFSEAVASYLDYVLFFINAEKLCRMEIFNY